MHRVFVSKNSEKNGIVTVSGEDAVHIGRSLRMREGEELLVSIDGVTYPSVICGFSKDTVSLKINGDALPSVEPPYGIILYQALVKGDSADEIIARACECGVSKTVFFSSSCCVAKAGDGFENRLARLKKISRESAMQSGRDVVPEVCPPITFDGLLSEIRNGAFTLFCYEGEGTVPIKKALENASFDSVAVIIGPEGGFTREEAEKITEAGAKPVGLGKRILRAKTAPTVALSAIMCLNEMQ